MYSIYRMAAVRSFEGLDDIYYSEELIKELAKMGARMVVRFNVRHDKSKAVKGLTVYVYCYKRGKVYKYCMQHRFDYRKCFDYR